MVEADEVNLSSPMLDGTEVYPGAATRSCRTRSPTCPVGSTTRDDHDRGRGVRCGRHGRGVGRRRRFRDRDATSTSAAPDADDGTVERPVELRADQAAWLDDRSVDLDQPVRDRIDELMME
jgi:hypothetical protein